VAKQCTNKAERKDTKQPTTKYPKNMT